MFWVNRKQTWVLTRSAQCALGPTRAINPAKHPCAVNLVVQHCDPPYRAIGYTIPIASTFFSVSQGIALYPPFLGVSQNYVERGGG